MSEKSNQVLEQSELSKIDVDDLQIEEIEERVAPAIGCATSCSCSCSSTSCIVTSEK